MEINGFAGAFRVWKRGFDAKRRVEKHSFLARLWRAYQLSREAGFGVKDSLELTWWAI